MDSKTEEFQQLKAFSQNILWLLSEKANLPNCATHMEVFKRKNGGLVFLEVASRAPGANIKRSYKERHGIDLEAYHFQLQMDKSVVVTEKQTDKYTAWMYFIKQAGVVASLEFPQLQSEIVQCQYYIEAGEQMEQPRDWSKYQGKIAMSLLIRNSNYVELVQDFEYLKTFKPYRLVEPSTRLQPENTIVRTSAVGMFV